MKAVPASRAALGTMAIAALCAGCGGGGGGGSDESPSASAEVPLVTERPIVTAREVLPISISSVQPNITYETYEGPALTHWVNVKAEGDLAAIDGKTVYVIVEMPDALFLPNPEVGLLPALPGAVVKLVGASPWKPGQYKDTIRLYVCTDPECRTQLKNSPLSIPYDIKVMRGLSLAPSSLDLSFVRNSTTSSVDVEVTLPEGGSDWEFDNSQSDGFAQKVGTKLRITPRTDLPAGSYQRTVRIKSYALASQGGTIAPKLFERELIVQYRITP